MIPFCKSSNARDFVALCGGSQECVELLVKFVRRLWMLTVLDGAEYETLNAALACLKTFRSDAGVDQRLAAEEWESFHRCRLQDRLLKPHNSGRKPMSVHVPESLLGFGGIDQLVDTLEKWRSRISPNHDLRYLKVALGQRCFTTHPKRESLVATVLQLLAECSLIQLKQPASPQQWTATWTIDDSEPILNWGGSRPPVFDQRIYSAIEVVEAVLHGVVDSSDCQFFVARAIRSNYSADISAHGIATFHYLARTANEMNCRRVNLWQLIEVLKESIKEQRDQRQLRMFIEASASVSYFSPLPYSPGLIRMRSQSIDSEYLLTFLFGTPMAIPGFSQLFGGGLRLFDSKHRSSKQVVEAPGRTFGHSQQLSSMGRSILIRGHYGTGKSILAFTIAADIARKGGIALIVALESTVDEICSILASVGVEIGGESFFLAKSMQEVANALVLGLKEKPKGVLGVLSHFSFEEPDSNDSAFRHDPVPYTKILKNLREFSEHLPAEMLRLIVIDPVNALVREASPNDPTDLQERFETLTVLQKVKRTGCNLLITAEEDGKAWIGFGEDIADTVIRLKSGEFGRYTKRVISVTKSRLQREHRGEHPFSIVSGIGFDITLSTPAISAQNLARHVSNRDAGDFGLRALDRIMRSKIRVGDILLLRGRVGTFKTQLGLVFLRAPRPGSSGPRSAGLVISARLTQPDVDSKANSVVVSNIHESVPHKIFTCSIKKGFSTAGHIVRQIENAFSEAARMGYRIDRVLLDNPSEWSDACPLTVHDPGFPLTLVNAFLRRRDVCTVISDRLLSEPNDLWSRTILQEADFRIDLDLIELNGSEFIMLQCRKTRSMQHRRERFILKTNSQSGGFRILEPHFDVTTDGRVEPLTIRLLGHVETEAQHRYWQDKQSLMRSVISPNFHLEVLNRFSLGFTLDFAKTRSSNEIQVLALDEFELDWGTRKGLRRVPTRSFRGKISEVRRRIAIPVTQQLSNSLLAVPLYDNLSIMTVRYSAWSSLKSVITSWRTLAQHAEQAETDKPDEIFFDFPKGTAENFNCLYLEILLSLIREDTSAEGEGLAENIERELFGIGNDLANKLDIQHVFGHELATEAAVLFAILCRKAFSAGRKNRFERGKDSSSYGDYKIASSAKVMRHWFTTVQQHLQGDFSAASEICVVPLPSNVSTSGQWYLGIPRSSRKSQLAYSILRSLTSRDADIDRLHQGVGLPVRNELYAARPYCNQEYVLLRELDAEFFSNLSEHPIQRSKFKDYSLLSNTIAEHLIRLLTIANGLSRAELELRASDVVRSIKSSISFLSKQATD